MRIFQYASMIEEGNDIQRQRLQEVRDGEVRIVSKESGSD